MTSRTQPTTPRQAKPRRLNQAEKREANRQRILRAARSVFGRRGFHAASIDEIATEAGLSNGAIYYNFKSKGDLFFALLDERQEQRIRHLRRTLTHPPDHDGDRALAEEARDATRSLKESREWRLLLLEFTAHALRDPTLAPRLTAHKQKLRAAIEEVFGERLHARAVEPSLPLPELAIATTALVSGLATEELEDPGSVPDELLGELLARLLAPGDTAKRAA